MKKTHEDRMNLINRLERKYARKVWLQKQESRRTIKSALRAMRGRRLKYDNAQTESLDGIFRHGSGIA